MRRLAVAAGSLVGAAISVAGLVFVGLALARRWSDIGQSLGSIGPVSLVASLGAALTGLSAVALAWRRALGMLGVVLSRRAAVVLYFRGEIGKYVPGVLWPIVGRAELARRCGAPPAAAYSSVLLGLGALYLAAAFLALLGAGLAYSSMIWIGLMLAGSVTVLLLHPIVWQAAAALAGRLSKGRLPLPSRRQVIELVVRSVPGWLGIGTATWLVTRALVPGAGFLAVVGATALSWLVGFLVVPAPSGLGVREAVFVGVMAGGGLAEAAAAALMARLVFMVADAAAALVSTFGARRWAPKGAAAETAGG